MPRPAPRPRTRPRRLPPNPSAPVGAVGPVTTPVTPVVPPVGPVAVSPSGPVVASGDGVSVGDGCSVGGGCSPSPSRMRMIARINAPCPSPGPSVGSAGDSVGGSVGSSVGVSAGPVGPVGAVGSPVSVGPVGAVGSPDSPPLGPVGRGLGSPVTLGSPLTRRQRLPDLVSRLLGARGREQTQHHEEDHDLAKTVAQDANFHPQMIDGVSALARPRPPPQPPRHPTQPAAALSAATANSLVMPAAICTIPPRMRRAPRMVSRTASPSCDPRGSGSRSATVPLMG